MHHAALKTSIARAITQLILRVVALVPAASASATVIDATPASYARLIGTLKPGDTLNLAAGTYPLLRREGVNGTASARITIQGPSSGAPAVISINRLAPACCNVIQLENTSFLTLKQLRVDSALSDSIDGINARGTTHDIVVEDCTFVGQGAQHQTVAISTKGPAWNWVIRGNTIIEAGAGMYLGSSTGAAPFIGGLIEGNFIVDSIGYNMQIKWQAPYAAPAGLAPGPHQTVIRHNVFIKTKPQRAWPAGSADGARPNLLVGGAPP